MRRFAFLLVLLAALIITAAASADVPAPVVSACKAEYAQLGADAFAAKYGPTEPWGHCYEQHLPTATSSDSPAVTACKAEYVQLGPTAFAAKYGTPETFGNCVKAHMTTAPPPATPTTTDNPALAACKAEYLKLGADAFSAKYGKDALGQCVKLRGVQPTTSDPAMSVATAFCQALARTLGKDAFLAKFGPTEAMGSCVKALLASARSLVASCKASSGSSSDAFRACLAAGIQPRRR